MVQPGELMLRLFAALMFTAAAVVMGYFVHAVRKDKIRHPTMPLFIFLEAVVTLVAIWRWIVFWFGTLDQQHVAEVKWFVEWVNPINQSLFGLLGFALCLHGILNLRKLKLQRG